MNNLVFYMMPNRKHTYVFDVKLYALRIIFWEYNEIFKCMCGECD
jgi:hypothetical protein